MNKYQEALNDFSKSVIEIDGNVAIVRNEFQGWKFNLYKKQIMTLQELVDRATPIKPKILSSHPGIKFDDGRKSPDFYIGRCECSQIVYSTWKCCPYCLKALEWSKELTDSTNINFEKIEVNDHVSE